MTVEELKAAVEKYHHSIKVTILFEDTKGNQHLVDLDGIIATQGEMRLICKEG